MKKQMTLTLRSRLARGFSVAILTLVLATLWVLSKDSGQVAYAQAPDPPLPSATVSVWNITPKIGFNPDVSIEDVKGLTGHVATTANPLSIAVACDNCSNPQGPCGVMFWNPKTNLVGD